MSLISILIKTFLIASIPLLLLFAYKMRWIIKGWYIEQTAPKHYVKVGFFNKEGCYTELPAQVTEQNTVNFSKEDYEILPESIWRNKEKITTSNLWHNDNKRRFLLKNTPPHIFYIDGNPKPLTYDIIMNVFKTKAKWNAATLCKKNREHFINDLLSGDETTKMLKYLLIASLILNVICIIGIIMINSRIGSAAGVPA